MRNRRELSSSTASSTRPTLLHRSIKGRRGKFSPASSLSAWAPGTIFRKSIPQLHQSELHGSDQGNLLGEKLKPKGNIIEDRKGSFLGRDRANRHKKSVTIEEPNEKVHTDSESDAGTVRRSTKSGHAAFSNSLPSRLEDGINREAHRPQQPNEVQASGNEVARKNNDRTGNALEVDTANPQNPDNLQRQFSQSRKRSRTVSRDDYLTARGANPRTGVVSPSVTNSSLSDPLGSHAKYPSSVMSQKWRLKGDQWISLDANEKTPLPTPFEEEASPQLPLNARDQAKEYIGLISDTNVPRNKLDDRFVVNMPSAREPCPPTMTPQQILDYQKAIERVHRNNEEMVDPNTAPSPRVVTPEGPSTPPNKLSKINPLKLIKKNRWGFSPKQVLVDSALTPVIEGSQGNNKREKEGDGLCNGESNLQQDKNVEQARVSFLGKERVTKRYQENNAYLQAPNGCPNSPNRHRRPRADSLQERRLLKKDQLNSLNDPIPILHLESTGGQNVSTAITTKTTTSTITPTLSYQVGDILSGDHPTKVGEEARFLDSAVLVTSLNAAAAVGEDGTVPSVEATHIFENIGQTTTQDLAQKTKVSELDGCTPMEEIEYGDIDDIDIDIPYPKLLTHFVWFFLSTLEYLLTAIIYFLNGTIWVCKMCRRYQRTSI